MKITHRPAYAQQISMITLETDAERALTDAQLLCIAANVEGIEYNQRTDSYDLTGGDLGEAPPLGGTVLRSGDHCEIAVHTGKINGNCAAVRRIAGGQLQVTAL